MKKLAFVGILAITSSSFALPFADIQIGVGYNSLFPSGWVQYQGDKVDVKDDLNLGDSKKPNVYIPALLAKSR